ncbi:TIGR04372 family glycosyltransferase [Pseudodesulfovibrio sediminis]|uniref:Uncharacterized protein n=1 Tax=Pseudodesulfovibrio sediminis TaxID=2810563 RepID=A0ABN6EPZ7_9BACT|nr:TIGR04372 family glycosyltransferase [Pseudodesulfovibrio sediminis]BCS87527.1 hypothetical protein PSDVSF_07690 [Pseudodesulfovibrio sediminis]
MSQPHYRINLRWVRLFTWPLLLPFALLLALFNLLSPVPFKIYTLRVDRIGHMGGNTELFCSLRDLGELPKEFRFFVHRDRPCNPALLEMWGRTLPIKQIFLPLFDICHKLGGLGVISRDIEKMGTLDLRNLMSKTKQHLHFSDTELAEAQQQAAALGLQKDRPFIPVLGRDYQYLLEHNPHEDNTHYEFRNTDINTYIPALEHLAERFTVVRAGNIAQTRVDSQNRHIIDYPFTGKVTPLMDIYLAGQCHFYITCGTGPDTLAAQCFRRPTLWVNLIPPSMLTNWGKHNLSIIKHYWSVPENRYLTLSEILGNDVLAMYNAHEMMDLGVKVIDNSPQEIMDAVKEMEQRLDGTWQTIDEDEARQTRFWEIFKAKYPDRDYVAHVGTQFLRDNPHWLE